MHKFLRVYLFLLFIFFNEAYCQNQAQQKIIQAMGFEQFQQLSNNHPDSLKLLEFLVEDGFSITNKQYITVIDVQKLPSVSLPSDCFENGIPQKTKINILTLPVTFNRNQHNYYQISESDFILKLRPLSYIEKKSKSKPIN